MTAAPSRTPRTPTYRGVDQQLYCHDSARGLYTWTATKPWERARFNVDYIGAHRPTMFTPPGFTVPAIVERVR